MKPSEIAEWTIRWMNDPESYEILQWPEEYPPPYRDEHLQLARAYLRLREAVKYFLDVEPDEEALDSLYKALEETDDDTDR